MASKVSLELYPQRTGGDTKALRTADAFVPDAASFVSVTCAKQAFDCTLRLCAQLHEHGHEPAPHLVGAGYTRAQIEQQIASTVASGYRHIVALRGDQLSSTVGTQAVLSTQELVKMIASSGHFTEIMVGGYPDVHPDAQSAESDLRHLLGKIEAGATRVITQFCFEADTLCRFRDRLNKQQVTLPISAGVLPVRNYAGMLQFANRCKASVPASLQARFEQTPLSQHAGLAAALLEQQVRQLVAAEFDIHFYTLNSVTMLNEAWLAVTAAQQRRHC